MWWHLCFNSNITENILFLCTNCGTHCASRLNSVENKGNNLYRVDLDAVINHSILFQNIVGIVRLPFCYDSDSLQILNIKHLLGHDPSTGILGIGNSLTWNNFHLTNFWMFTFGNCKKLFYRSWTTSVVVKERHILPHNKFQFVLWISLNYFQWNSFGKVAFFYCHLQFQARWIQQKENQRQLPAHNIKPDGVWC